MENREEQGRDPAGAAPTGDPPRRGPVSETARRLLWIFFFTFPLVLTLLPPDVYGDRVHLPYLGLLFITGFWTWRRARTRRKLPPQRVPGRPLVARIAAFTKRHRVLLIALVVPPGLVAVILTGYFVGALLIMWPTRFLCLAGILAPLWLAQRFGRPAWLRVVRITLPRVYFVMLWVFLISFAVFSKSPSREECEGVRAQPGVKTLLSLAVADQIPELNGTAAYMAVPDTSGRFLYAAFKPLSHQYVRVARLDLSEGEAQPPRVRLLSLPPDQSIGIAQLVAYDPADGRLYAPVFGEGQSRLLVVDCTEGRFDLAGSIPLEGEPGDILLDADGRLLHLALKPSRLVTYQLPDLRILREGELPIAGGIEGMVADPKGDWLYVSSVGFHVAATSLRTGTTIRRFMLTSMGLDLSAGERPHLFVASPGLSTLYVLDPRTLETEGSLRIGGALRQVRADPARGLVYAGSYASGIFHILDASQMPPRIIDSIRLGKVLRRITVDPFRGRVFVPSSCGIFQVVPEERASLRARFTGG